MFNAFGEEIKSLRLTPGQRGEFSVWANGHLLFSKKEAGRFPEVKEVFEALNRRLEALSAPQKPSGA